MTLSSWQNCGTLRAAGSTLALAAVAAYVWRKRAKLKEQAGVDDSRQEEDAAADEEDDLALTLSPSEPRSPREIVDDVQTVQNASMGAQTVQAALEACGKVGRWTVSGPIQVAGSEETDATLVCFNFRMSHFACKAFLAGGARDEGSRHLKLQTIFEDSRRTLGEEQRYFIANEWNATKRYTRLKCAPSGVARSSVFTLEYDVLVPKETTHSWGLRLLAHTLRMWYTSMVACVMHIVERRDVPFATHEMIIGNTLTLTIGPEDGALQGQTCPICLESFKPGDKVRRLPCLHVFHVVSADTDPAQGQYCNIDRHLVRDKQCPSCKTPIDVMERVASGNPEATASEEPSASNEAQVQAAAAVRCLCEPPQEDAETENHGAVSSNADEAVNSTAAARASEESTSVSEATAAIQQASSAPGNATEATNSDPLPRQAAELEQAVRNLQSRWLQIQDVVAGMRQMLSIIEESRALARDLQGQDGENGEPGAAEHPAGDAAPVATPVQAALENQPEVAAEETLAIASQLVSQLGGRFTDDTDGSTSHEVSGEAPDAPSGVAPDRADEASTEDAQALSLAANESVDDLNADHAVDVDAGALDEVGAVAENTVSEAPQDAQGAAHASREETGGVLESIDPATTAASTDLLVPANALRESSVVTSDTAVPSDVATVEPAVESSASAVEAQTSDSWYADYQMATTVAALEAARDAQSANLQSQRAATVAALEAARDAQSANEQSQAAAPTAVALEAARDAQSANEQSQTAATVEQPNPSRASDETASIAVQTLEGSLEQDGALQQEPEPPAAEASASVESSAERCVRTPAESSGATLTSSGSTRQQLENRAVAWLHGQPARGVASRDDANQPFTNLERDSMMQAWRARVGASSGEAQRDGSRRRQGPSEGE